MKKLKLIISAAVAVSAMFGIGTASAADLAVKAMPYAVPAPAFSWTGCYVGVHGGAGVLLDQGFQQRVLFDDRHGVGGLAGGQIGCNYQTGRLVFGIEGEGFWSGMKVTNDQFGGINGNTLLGTASIRNNWDYDIAGGSVSPLTAPLFTARRDGCSVGFHWNWAIDSATEIKAAPLWMAC